jgi:hypothetical protein
MSSKITLVECSSNEQIRPHQIKTISESSSWKAVSNDNDTQDELNTLLKPLFVFFLPLSI